MSEKIAYVTVEITGKFQNYWVKVETNEKLEVKSLEIDRQLIRSGDAIDLQDLIVATVNLAFQVSLSETVKAVGKILTDPGKEIKLKFSKMLTIVRDEDGNMERVLEYK
jgi:DNA-binding protein YbaB